jgi:competence protein ComEA
MNDSIYKKGLAVVLIISIIIMTAVGVKLSSKEEDISFGNINEEELNVLVDDGLLNKEKSTDNGENKVKSIIVDVDGAILNPGVYEFVEGDRIEDAIIKAGGLLENANTKNINRARLLKDGEKIYIAKEGENNFDIEIIDTSIYNTDEAIENNDKININTASKEVLMSLDGIGEVYSQRIIDYRNNIKFSSIEELKLVKGIGEKTFEKIKDIITVE